MKLLKDFYDGEHVDGQFLIAAMAKCTSNAGKAYLNITLQDSSGTLMGKKWEVDDGDETLLAPGRVVSISGEVLDYKGQLQMKIIGVRDLDQNKVDAARFALPCPVDPTILTKKLDEYIASIKDPVLSAITSSLIKEHYDAYISHPAAVRNHHACLSGLLYHSIAMTDLASFVLKMYPDLDHDLLISGCLLHDLGKIYELSGAIATRYTLKGRLLGHISIGANFIALKAKELGFEDEEKAILLEHMVLSHHGDGEKGSPVRPETKEALALHYIDDFNAKMDILEKALNEIEVGEWTNKLFALNDGYFYHHE